MTTLFFNLCNTLILVAWAAILFFPKSKVSKLLISFPGIVFLFKNATPESAAAGWLHYLAFDFWVGTWMIRHSQKFQIKHILIVLPLLCTFMLGPIGILI